jgi:Na+:H+ antiporter, NhaA family
MATVPPPTEGESVPKIRSLTTTEEFIKSESAGAILLLVAAVLALVWANSSYSASYFALWKRSIGLSLGGVSFAMDLGHWIDDGLMSIFFLVVGLEIKREILQGELSSWRRAALPAMAALGGMVVPAAIYFALNRHGEAARGWAIPMATDIGFAVGVLALLGKRIPSSLRVFMLALAIIDDVGAILVIALFYTQHISVAALGIALVVLAVLLAFSFRAPNTAIYVILGLVFWVAVLKSGVHATIAGVILGFLAPLKPRYAAGEMIPLARRLLEKLGLALQNRQEETAEVALSELQTLTHGTESMAGRLEKGLHPWVSFGILPLFALANAGIVLSAAQIQAAIISPAAIGIFLGLVVGKVIGVAGFSFLAVRLRLSVMSEGANWHHLIGAGMLAGIGFTVALFVSGLAFTEQDLELTARMAILFASLVSGIMGYTYLRFVPRRTSL